MDEKNHSVHETYSCIAEYLRGVLEDLYKAKRNLQKFPRDGERVYDFRTKSSQFIFIDEALTDVIESCRLAGRILGSRTKETAEGLLRDSIGELLESGIIKIPATIRVEHGTANMPPVITVDGEKL